MLFGVSGLLLLLLLLVSFEFNNYEVKFEFNSPAGAVLVT